MVSHFLHIRLSRSRLGKPPSRTDAPWNAGVTRCYVRQHGYNRRPLLLLLLCLQMDGAKDFHDGGGLCSPGRWGRDRREHAGGPSWTWLREKLQKKRLIGICATSIKSASVGDTAGCVKSSCRLSASSLPNLFNYLLGGILGDGGGLDWTLVHSYTCMRTCAPAHICRYMYMYIQTYGCAHMHTCVNACIHTYIH